MKRNFREPKNRYRNGAKNARQKIATLKSCQSLENKGKKHCRTGQKSCQLAKDGTKIRRSGNLQDDSDS